MTAPGNTAASPVFIVPQNKQAKLRLFCFPYDDEPPLDCLLTALGGLHALCITHENESPVARACGGVTGVLT
jgi:hypothetical protein